MFLHRCPNRLHLRFGPSRIHDVLKLEKDRREARTKKSTRKKRNREKRKSILSEIKSDCVTETIECRVKSEFPSAFNTHSNIAIQPVAIQRDEENEPSELGHVRKKRVTC